MKQQIEKCEWMSWSVCDLRAAIQTRDPPRSKKQEQEEEWGGLPEGDE